MKTEKTSPKILLALQFWEKDRRQAMELARFIADLEPGHCETADFIFVNRFDCLPDKDTEGYVSRKFNFYRYKSPRRETGWPDGCNGTWMSTMEWFYFMAEANKIPRYKTIFTFEADCVPLRSDWIKYFSAAWDTINKMGKIYVAGRKLESHGIREHVNGNAFFSGDLKFLHWLVKRTRIPAGVGWDYYLADEFRRWGWADMPGMECWWNTPTFTEEQFRNELNKGTAWLHGIKDRSLIEFSRKLLLT